MSDTKSIAAAASGLASGAVVAALTSLKRETGRLPSIEDRRTYERALELLNEAERQDARVLALARQLVEWRLDAIQLPSRAA